MPSVQISDVADAPIPFGYKTGWIAVRADSSADVAAALEAHDTRVANWQSGLTNTLAQEGDTGWVFLTPPVAGWVLVHIELLIAPDHDAGITWLRTCLDRLSVQFEEAQYFGSYRVVSFVAWMRSQNGTLTRGVSYVGGGDGLLLLEGPATEVEVAAGFDVLDGVSVEEAEERLIDMMEDGTPMPAPDLSEAQPLNIARSWSVDPSQFGDMHTDPGVGLLARITLP